MNILVTNDDGVSGEGLQSLIRNLSKKANVYVVAPSGNRSGVSCYITMYHSLELKRIEENVYSCSGCPVDCVITGVHSDLFPGVKFDAVLSGINKGANMGTDVVYSGTAAGARQAALYGIPAVALSLESEDGNFDFEPFSAYVCDNLEYLLSVCKKGAFVNVNAYSRHSYKGIEFATLSNRNYHDKVTLEKKEDGFVARFESEYLTSTGDERNDYKLSLDGYVAVSLIGAQPDLFE